MAAYGGHNDQAGLQIFVTIRRGSEWPPRTCDVRIRYEQSLLDLRTAVAQALDIPATQIQLFRHGKELVMSKDSATLLDLGIHTGFGLQGWDMRVPPEYWPPVEETTEGLRIRPVAGL